MGSDLEPDEAVRTASEAEAAEAIFDQQPEDHPLPAREVFGEQRDEAANGPAKWVFIP